VVRETGERTRKFREGKLVELRNNKVQGESTFTCPKVNTMTKDEIVKALVEQVVEIGFKIRLITFDAGFYIVDVLNFISQFNYIIAVPVGDVKDEEFNGDYKTNR
jgi:IS4 transposase